MNKRQLVALWTMALLLCIGLVLSTYNVKYIKKPKPYTLDDLLGVPEGEEIGWHVSKVNRIDIVFVNLIRYTSPVLIIGGVLIYSLRDKKR